MSNDRDVNTMSTDNEPTAAQHGAVLRDALLHGDAGTAAQVATFLATDRCLGDLQAAITAGDTAGAVVAFAGLDDDTQCRVLGRAMDRLVNGDGGHISQPAPTADVDITGPVAGDGADDADGM
jgi:hypothetical protein